MEKVVSLELIGQWFHESETSIRSVGHRDRDRSVELDHRRGPHRLEAAVERCDLRPIGVLGSWRPGMQRGDRRLHLIGTGPPHLYCRVDERQPFIDHLLIPASSVLVLQQHEVAVFIDASMASGVLQQHQRKQADRLGLPWHQPVHDAY